MTLKCHQRDTKHASLTASAPRELKVPYRACLSRAVSLALSPSLSVPGQLIYIVVDLPKVNFPA